MHESPSTHHDHLSAMYIKQQTLITSEEQYSSNWLAKIAPSNHSQEDFLTSFLGSCGHARQAPNAFLANLGCGPPAHSAKLAETNESLACLQS